MSNNDGNKKVNDWQVEELFDIKFIDNIHKEYLQNRNIKNSTRILDKLVTIPIDVSEIDNSEYWPEICSLLKLLLNDIPLEVMLRDHQIIMLSLIYKSPERFIQIIAENYFTPSVKSLRNVFKDTALAILVGIARRIRGQICAESVANFLCYFLDVKEVMQELMTQLNNQNDSECRFRVYQVALSAMALPDFNDYTIIRPIIDELVKEINEEHVLTCITALELLSNVTALQKQNAIFLGSIGLLDMTYDLFQKSIHNPDGGLIHSACIRFFGYLTHTDPNALIRYPLFSHEIFDMVYHFDQIDAVRRQLAFDTLAMITTSSEAKKFLSSSQCQYNIKKAMNHFGVVITHSPDDLRVRLLGSLRLMMSESLNENDSNILHNWFLELGDPFPTVLLHLLQKPFEDVKIATLELLKILFCLHDWSINVFNKVEGFYDYLLDRKLGDSANIFQLMFEVICGILESNSINVLDQKLVERFKQSHEHGVYFIENEEPDVEWGAI